MFAKIRRYRRALQRFKHAPLIQKDDKSRSLAYKAIYWFWRRDDWISALETEFESRGIEEILVCIPELYFLFRRQYVFMHKDSNDELEKSAYHALIPIVAEHFSLLSKVYGTKELCKLNTDMGLGLCHQEINRKNIGFSLNYIHRNRREGMTTLTLWWEGEALYFMNFLIKENSIWIGSIQGAKGKLELMRKFTRWSQGVPPQRVLYFALTVLSQKWGIQEVFGITHNAQVFQREEKTRYKLENFNYDDFWEQLSPLDKDEKWWKLPVPYVLKDLNSVNAKKRGKLKKRYTLLGKIESCLVKRYE